MCCQHCSKLFFFDSVTRLAIWLLKSIHSISSHEQLWQISPVGSLTIRLSGSYTTSRQLITASGVTWNRCDAEEGETEWESVCVKHTSCMVWVTSLAHSLINAARRVYRMPTVKCTPATASNIKTTSNFQQQLKSWLQCCSHGGVTMIKNGRK